MKWTTRLLALDVAPLAMHLLSTCYKVSASWNGHIYIVTDNDHFKPAWACMVWVMIWFSVYSLTLGFESISGNYHGI
jgi:hypothetical protein